MPADPKHCLSGLLQMCSAPVPGTPILEPFFFIRSSSIPWLLSVATKGGLPPPTEQPGLQHLVVQLLQQTSLETSSSGSNSLGDGGGGSSSRGQCGGGSTGDSSSRFGGGSGGISRGGGSTMNSSGAQMQDGMRELQVVGRDVLCGVDIGAGRLRVDTLLWLMYADELIYSKGRSLEIAETDERAAIANTAGMAARGGLPVKASSTAKEGGQRAGCIGSSRNGVIRSLGAKCVASGSSRIAGCSNVTAVKLPGSLNGGVGFGKGGSSAGGAASGEEEKRGGSSGVASFDQTFFKRVEAVNTEGVQQPFYKLAPSFYSSQAAREAAVSGGVVLKAGTMAAAATKRTM